MTRINATNWAFQRIRQFLKENPDWHIKRNQYDADRKAKETAQEQYLEVMSRD